jgi:hypothetical protein
MTTAYRYATADTDGSDVTVMLDLCHRCAAQERDHGTALDRADAPSVEWDDEYRCDRCDRRITLS